MIVIAKDTEEKLFEELKKYKTEKPNQRCFYLPFSKTNLPRRTLFECFLKHLKEVPNSYMAQVYFCADSDVMILMHGFMQRQFTSLLENIGAELGTSELQKLGTVFEIGVHWPKLENICHEKIASISWKKQKNQEAEATKQASAQALNILSKLEETLVLSISERRKKRAETLIMVADDDQLSRILVGNVLREDYQVTFAKTGFEAIEEYVKQAPDILFLDIGLPDINGHDALEIIFQVDPAAHIIMFSGRKDQENIMRALEAGAKGFLEKPFTREKIYQHTKKLESIKKELITEKKSNAY